MADEITRRPPGAHALLARILEDPALVRHVQSLEPRALGRLIDRVGLEDSAELVALATTEQLQRIFDDDLWHAARPGQEERFDPARFGLWLEVMLEAGERFAAEKLTELPEELVGLALHRQAIVLNLDERALDLSESKEEEDLVDKVLDGVLSEEIGEYLVIARRHDGWDALVRVLLALDEAQHDFLVGLLDRCAHASQSYIEDHGGLYDVLTSEEMLESDAAAERDDRRAAEGFVSPSDAAAFLGYARVTSLEKLMSSSERDPITRTYFRRYERRARPSDAPSTPLAELLEETEEAAPARPLLGAGDGGDELLVTRALVALSVRNAEAHAHRVDELGYLANVLIAGATRAGRRYRPFEAAEAALALCDRGLAQLLDGSRDVARAAELLVSASADKLFRIGWHLDGAALSA
ncbi:MAG: hypothetical protein JWN44_5722 [Myxococcales bacterium]|nr:hypothetical protein [Myxococcales bacterium]